MAHVTFAIQSSDHEGRRVLHLSGDLDLAARERLLREGESSLGPWPLLLDLSDARLIDASVIGALFHLSRLTHDRGGRMAVVDARAKGRCIWQLTGYPEVCPVYPSVQEAAAALAR